MRIRYASMRQWEWDKVQKNGKIAGYDMELSSNLQQERQRGLEGLGLAQSGAFARPA